MLRIVWLGVFMGHVVEVNEENKSALRFYKRLGFWAVGRSATDAGGRPLPTVHLQRPAPGAQTAK
jgi:putative acetyltransferase